MGRHCIRITDSCLAAGDKTPKPGSRFYTYPSLTRPSDGAHVCTTLGLIYGTRG